VKNITIVSLFASYLIRVVPNSNLDADFLKLFIESPFYWKQLYKAAWGAGQPNVNGTSLSRLVLALPPLEEQKEIVKKIESLFKICDELETQINNSKTSSQTLMQAVLKEAFENA
jgi:restriction endonuclease S subunit